MNRLRYSLFSIFLYAGSLFSDSVPNEPVFEPSAFEKQLLELDSEPHSSKRLHQLFEIYWEWYLSENPEEATFLGYPGQHGQWLDLSSDSIKKHYKTNDQFLRALNAISHSELKKEDLISLGILKRILEEQQANAQFGSYHLLVNQMDGIHLMAPLVIESMPNHTFEEYTHILSRLRQLPKLFAQAIELLEQGIKAGITPPRIAIRHVPEQILNQIIDPPLKSSLLRAFNYFPTSIDSETRMRLLEEAIETYQDHVIPAFKNLHDYVVETYLPQCRETIAFQDLPRGKEWYASRVRNSTGTQLTPQEIHEIGLKEVERIYHEMLEIIHSTGFEGSFSDFLHFLKTDPQFFFTSSEDILQGYRTLTQQIESQLPLLFSQFPSLPFEVIPIPSYSEESQIAAYYCSGSIADQRPGYFFINTSFPELRPTWGMIPLALHEAVPGHHLQITLAQELKNLPEFRKHTQFTSYIEGWGLYSESLGFELGLYHDPYALFGKLNDEMLRAIRLVIDTGMHAMGWSREEAIDFTKKYVGMSDHEIISEVDRYLVIPAQALAYKIGELKIQELRHLAKERLGSSFDIRDFHRAWLEKGTLPLDIAEQEILLWMETHEKVPSTI